MNCAVQLFGVNGQQRNGKKEWFPGHCKVRRNSQFPEYPKLGSGTGCGFVLWQHGGKGYRSDRDKEDNLGLNCFLAFCTQAEIRRKTVTSTPYFRHIKFERLAG